MSSYDEYFAAKMIGEMPGNESLVFPTQIDWIRALVDWFRERPNLFLLIRVHPREFPNKREGLKSEHAKMLEREFSDIPSNICVNWPTDGISIYELAEETEVFLNAWSSAGKEMAVLGLPVVVYCPTLLQYPAELGYVGETRETYFAAIQTALRTGWSFERIRAAYRWCALEYDRAIFDLSDSVHFSEVPAKGFFARVLTKLYYLFPNLRHTVDVFRRSRALKERVRIAKLIDSGATTILNLETPPSKPTETSHEFETISLREEVRRLTAALYPNANTPPRSGSLRERLERFLAN